MADYAVMAQKLIQKHFPKFGSFRELCTFHSMDSADYDADNRTVTPVILSSSTLYIIFADISGSAKMNVQVMDDEPIDSSYQNAIFPSLDLDVIPKNDDVIIRPNGETWVVIGTMKDPKPAHYSLVMRLVKG